LEAQASNQWLGGGEDGGVARALTFTAEFLESEGKIRSLNEDYSRHVNPAFVQMVLNGDC
jgi:taurine transport system substrate-binding protein